MSRPGRGEAGSNVRTGETSEAKRGASREAKAWIDLARDGSPPGRRRLAFSMTDLFDEPAEALTERGRALAVEILDRLIRAFETEVRRELAERLARKPGVPHSLIVMLANDEIEVARPILLESVLLGESDLIDIVRTRGLDHQQVIAMRSPLGEAVCDALVETDNVDVIRTLLRNREAKIAEPTMAYIVEEAHWVDAYREPLVQRRELKPPLVRRLYRLVSAALRSHILEHFDIDPNELDDALEEVAIRPARTPGKESGPAPGPEPGPASEPARRPTAPAQDSPLDASLAGQLASVQDVTPQLLIKLLRQGERAIFEQCFADLSQLPPARLHEVLYGPEGKDMATVCRALDFDKNDFALVLFLCRQNSPGEQVEDPREVAQLIEFFGRLSSETAQTQLRRWQRDPGRLAAAERGRTPANDD